MDNHTTPKPITQLEYARMIAQTHGENAPVTWLTVGEVIDLLETIEELKAQQPQPVELGIVISTEVTA